MRFRKPQTYFLRKAALVFTLPDAAHVSPGILRERHGDRQGALEKYRAACPLDPKHVTVKG